jgi:hypothetical protein
VVREEGVERENTRVFSTRVLVVKSFSGIEL